MSAARCVKAAMYPSLSSFAVLARSSGRVDYLAGVRGNPHDALKENALAGSTEAFDSSSRSSSLG